MAEQIQELINKIKADGIQEAQKQAQEILENAKKTADTIIADAKKEAQRIIQEAEEKTRRLEETTHATLQQVSRDMLLNLRGKIEALLNAIVREEIKGSLKGEVLAKVIEEVIKHFSNKNKIEDIKVILSEADYNALKKDALGKLQKKIKEGIKFVPTDNIGAGFLISFDGGKSSFDFSEESLVDYLMPSLNAEVAEIIKAAITK